MNMHHNAEMRLDRHRLKTILEVHDKLDKNQAIAAKQTRTTAEINLSYSDI